MSTALILAGGFGTRLRSVLGEKTPKPMADIQGTPFLSYWIRYLHQHGITRAILLLHHQPGHFQEYFGTHYAGVAIEYLVEPTPLGTGGAIRNGLQHMARTGNLTGPLLVTNGDSFLEGDWGAMLARHDPSTTLLTIAIHPAKDPSRYGTVEVQNGIVTAYREKSPLHTQENSLINGGVYVLSPTLFEGFELPTAFSFEQDFMMRYVALLQPRAFFTSDYFIDIGVPEEYARACTEIPARV